MRVLVVEDSPRVADVVGMALRAEGHHVEVAVSRAEADAALDRSAFDLAIVDRGLPDGCGLEWCRARRAEGRELPILVLTARTGVDDRIAGLDAGADDYLGKPFATAELQARVRALGRRGPRFRASKACFGDVTIDRDRRVVTRAGERVPLTARELDVVMLLAWREGRVVPRDEILEIVWGEVSEGGAASLEVVVARVRRKLDDAGTPSVIRTVRQVGYAWALGASKRG